MSAGSQSDGWRSTFFLGVFCLGFGVHLGHFPVWLEEARDLSSGQISFVVFGAVAARLLTGPILAVWSEPRSARCAGFQLASSAAIAMAAMNWLQTPAGLLVAGFFAVSAALALFPLGEAMLLRAAERARPSFGVGRAIGSVSFVIGVLVGGLAIDALGAEAIGPLLFALWCALAIAALWAPRFKMGGDGDEGLAERLRVAARYFRGSDFILLIAAAGLIQASHSFYYGFSAILWREQGASGLIVGLMWSFGVVVEIVLLALAARLPPYVTPERLLLIGGVAASLRWGLYALQPPLWLAFGLQSLHAASFAATFLGAIGFIRREFEVSERSTALALKAALISGGATGVFGLLSGPLHAQWGAAGYWTMAAGASVGAGLASIMEYRRARR